MALPIEKRLTPGFAALLADDFDLAQLEEHDSAILGLTDELQLGYANPAWYRFAATNGKLGIDACVGVGAPVLRAVGRVLRPFFMRAFVRCRRSHRPCRHDYHCACSDGEHDFHLEATPVAAGAGMLLLNALRHPVVAAEDSRYLRAEGTVVQCIHCRRVRRADADARWDWVPSFVESVPSNATGGLCPTCYRQRYPSAPPLDEQA